LLYFRHLILNYRRSVPSYHEPKLKIIMLSLKMLITKIGQVLIVCTIINLIDSNNYRCHYQHVFTHYFGKKVISCDFVKINFGKDESFNAVPPVEAKWKWTDGKFMHELGVHSFMTSNINFVTKGGGG